MGDNDTLFPPANPTPFPLPAPSEATFWGSVSARVGASRGWGQVGHYPRSTTLPFFPAQAPKESGTVFFLQARRCDPLRPAIQTIPHHPAPDFRILPCWGIRRSGTGRRRWGEGPGCPPFRWAGMGPDLVSLPRTSGEAIGETKSVFLKLVAYFS